MTMIVVNIHDAKARLSEYLDRAARGERIVICKRNQPVAELRAVEPARTTPRQLAGGPHRFDVPDAFFEPLPEPWIEDLESAAVYPPMPRSSQPVRVAERTRLARPRTRRRR